MSTETIMSIPLVIVGLFFFVKLSRKMNKKCQADRILKNYNIKHDEVFKRVSKLLVEDEWEIVRGYESRITSKATGIVVSKNHQGVYISLGKHHDTSIHPKLKKAKALEKLWNKKVLYLVSNRDALRNDKILDEFGSALNIFDEKKEEEEIKMLEIEPLVMAEIELG